jgi:hypothetical protein
MRLSDFEGRAPDEVRTMLEQASNSQKLDLLVGLVMRNRSRHPARALCPRCEGEHDRDRGKFTDRGGRVWHGDCVAAALAEVKPDHPMRTPYPQP